MTIPGSRSLRTQIASGASVLVLGGGSLGTWAWHLHEETSQLAAKQAVAASVATNLTGRVDALEGRLEALRTQPSGGISSEAKLRIRVLDQQMREVREQLRELERGRP